jgi:hypothetical protein
MSVLAGAVEAPFVENIAAQRKMVNDAYPVKIW